MVKQYKGIIVYSVLMFLIFFVFLEGSNVQQRSMEPTIRDGALIISQRHLINVDSEDIITFIYNDTRLTKRVIAKGGDTLVIKNGDLFLNGEKLKEDYAIGKTYSDTSIFIVPPHSYFVLGDNREYSVDSRAWDNPYVSESAIISKYLFSLT